MTHTFVLLWKMVIPANIQRLLSLDLQEILQSCCVEHFLLIGNPGSVLSGILKASWGHSTWQMKAQIRYADGEDAVGI